MTISQGRVIKCPENLGSTPAVKLPLAQLKQSPPIGRVIPGQLVLAKEQARLTLEHAQLEAQRIIDTAQRESETLLEETRKSARLEAEHALASAWIAFRARQAQTAQDTLQNTVDLARLLAERILAEQLRLHPETIQALALGALKTLRRAQRIRVFASPQSAQQLRCCLSELQSAYDIMDIQEEPNRPDSDLRFECDLGCLDASIGPQLDRLAIALREALAKE